MPKHPVPKKQTNKRVSKQRYGSFKTKVLRKLTNRVNLVNCPDCGSKALAHTACTECGKYRGREVVKKRTAADKIKTIKA